MTDMAKELLFNSIDSQWENFGKPKLRKDLGLPEREPEREVELTEDDIMEKAFSELERENAWIEANSFTMKDRSESRNRHHGKQNAKKRNKKLNNSKGKNSLYLAKRPEDAGTKCVLSNKWSEHNKTFHKEWYPDTAKGIEQNKVSARELEEHFKFSMKDKEKEIKNQCEYYKGIHNTTLEDLVKEYLSVRYNVGRLIVDPFVWCNSYEDILSKCWTDYEKERDRLCETICLMKRKENAISPLKEIVSACDIYSLGICKRKLPDNFNFYNLESELYVRMIDGDYIFYAQYVDNANKGSGIEMLPLFYVDRWYIPRENVEKVIMRICDIYTNIWCKYNF